MGTDYNKMKKAELIDYMKMLKGEIDTLYKISDVQYHTIRDLELREKQLQEYIRRLSGDLIKREMEDSAGFTLSDVEDVLLSKDEASDYEKQVEFDLFRRIMKEGGL